MVQQKERRETGADTVDERIRHAPMIDTALAYMYKPLAPITKRITLGRSKDRNYDPSDVLVPEGFTVEVVATGLNAPVHCSFDDQGSVYVTECGHKIESKPRVLKIDPRTGEKEVFFDLPEDRWDKYGAFTGTLWHDGHLYFSNTDTVSRLRPDGAIEDLVTDLPGRGDHQTNYPVLGPDGKIYWGQGTATNTAVVGADNFAYEWLKAYPDFHDRPGQDVVLNGHNYEFQNVLGSITETVRTGGYVPFGTETHPGQVIKGTVKASGSVLRCNPDGSGLELVAWGLRNPYGIAFHPDGRLFANEHGIDERNARHIIGDLEDFYEIIEGAWYGWPDFASGIRLDDPHWGKGGRGREPLLAEHPDPNPPEPFVSYAPHASPNGVDFCRSAEFGFEGDAFVALFGDITPVTARLPTPVGFKVARVDMKNRRVVDFAVNKIVGPSSKLPHSGFDRPSHCGFGPDGALYVVDWGEIQVAAEKGGIRMPKGSGSLWRIRRTGERIGTQPPPPRRAPSYAIKTALGVLGGATALAIAARAFIRRAQA